MTDAIKWGEPIPAERVCVQRDYGRTDFMYSVSEITLPADHPYYTKQPTEGVTAEWVERVGRHLGQSGCLLAGDDLERQDLLAEYEAATKTDPLVEAFDGLVTDPKKMAENLRVRLSKYGFSITQAPK
jgi:hypothetical protein